MTQADYLSESTNCLLTEKTGPIEIYTEKESLSEKFKRYSKRKKEFFRFVILKVLT